MSKKNAPKKKSDLSGETRFSDPLMESRRYLASMDSFLGGDGMNGSFAMGTGMGELRLRNCLPPGKPLNLG